jgi:hypothetical protein
MSLFCVGLCPLPSARAQVVLFNNFGPGDAYDVTSGWGVGAIAGNQEAFALAFTPRGGDYRLNAVALAMGLLDRDAPNEFDVRLTTDVGGAPGLPLETIHLSGAVPISGLPNPPVLADSATHPLLRADRPYFVAVTAGTETTGALWNLNSTGDIEPTALWSAAQGGEWLPGNVIAPAMRITATPVAAAPEPGVFALLIGPLSGVILLWCRRPVPFPPNEAPPQARGRSHAHLP